LYQARPQSEPRYKSYRQNSHLSSQVLFDVLPINSQAQYH
ncbi:hypothetical protein VCHENC02_5848, partial [Vibrio harveyi]